MLNGLKMNMRNRYMAEYKCPKCGGKWLVNFNSDKEVPITKFDNFYCQVEAKCLDCDSHLLLTYKMNLDNVETIK